MDQEEVRKRLIALIHKLTQADPLQLQAGAAFKDIGHWDSLTNVEVLMGIRDIFALDLAPVDFEGCITVSDLTGVLCARLKTASLVPST